MHHTCEHCATHYEIPDDRVRGRFLKVRCKSCHGTMHVVGVDPAGGDGAARWWCAVRNEPRGPFTADEVLLFIDVHEVTAHSRMWCTGMPGWERVCESSRLSWVYARLLDRLSAEQLASARTGTGSFDPFAAAALISDGQGWFPDPTLKSGIFILDEGTQARLETLARQGGLRQPERRDDAVAHLPRRSRTAIATIVGGAAAAAAGVFWTLVEQMH